MGQFSELGAFRTLVHKSFAVAEVVAPSVSVITDPLYSLWKSVVVLNMVCQLRGGSRVEK